MSTPIDEGFPLRKRTTDSPPTLRPEWATEVEADEWNWVCRTYVDVPPFGRIEVAQWAENEENGQWEISQPRVEVTESGVGDPAVCEAIADAIDQGEHSRIEHFILFNEPLQEGKNIAALEAYALDRRECASLLRAINPDRERDYPEVWRWLGEPPEEAAHSHVDS